MTDELRQKIRARNRADVTVDVVVDTQTGTWELRARDGLVVAKGEAASREGAKMTLQVTLGYDPSAYFDAIVDRQRAKQRADQLRSALADITGAQDIDDAQDIARAALESPFELAVRDEQEEDEV